MGGKILFVEDEISDNIKKILQKIEGVDQKEAETRVEAKIEQEIYSFATSFEDAVQKIKKVGKGEEYSWFFIDRNLEKFGDIQTLVEDEKGGASIDINGIKFDKAFFECFKCFEGDYLYFLLRRGGVPLEKICFLTANDPYSDVENSGLKSTPFLMKENVDRIVKGGQKSGIITVGFGTNNIGSRDLLELVDRIQKTPEPQIRFKYSVIFNNEKVKNALGESLLCKFLELLKKSEQDGVIFEQNDGMTLRNMVECVMRHIFTDFDGSVRQKLNDPKNEYNFKLQFQEKVDVKYDQNKTLSSIDEWKFMFFALENPKVNRPLNPKALKYYYLTNNWGELEAEKLSRKIVDNYDSACKGELDFAGEFALWARFSNHIGRGGLPGDESLLNDYLKNKIGLLENLKDKVSDILLYGPNKLYHYYLNCIAASKFSENRHFPPKYIFSYIDNIYTVTSEISAHGWNKVTTKELSKDGWNALLFGMCQILQWMAKKYPNEEPNP